jgi:hypothetical protein
MKRWFCEEIREIQGLVGHGVVHCCPIPYKLKIFHKWTIYTSSKSSQRNHRMKSTFSLIRRKLDACKKDVIELEKMYNQIREALDTVPFTLRHRQQIEVTVLRCAKKITLLKSRVLNAEILSRHTEAR